MPKDVYPVERLVVGVEEPVEREPRPDSDLLRITLSIKNPLGSPGSTRRPPFMEIWDAAGRTYEPVNDDWAEPVLPDTEITRRVDFEIAVDAAELELVLAPAEPEEVRVPLEGV